MSVKCKIHISHPRMLQKLDKPGIKWSLLPYFCLPAKFQLIQSGIFTPVRAHRGGSTTLIMSTQQQTNSETLEQQKSNSWTPEGPTKDRSSGSSQLNWKRYTRAIIKSEAWPTGVKLKRSAKLVTMTWLTTMQSVAFAAFSTHLSSKLNILKKIIPPYLLLVAQFFIAFHLFLLRCILWAQSEKVLVSVHS